ncbi:MAG: ATP-binding protein [Acidobacteriota bacterium]
MAEQAILREVTLTLPLAQGAEIAASNAATAMAELMSMSADRVDEVRLAVIEACINAIEHSKTPDGTVFITCEILGTAEPEILRITVRDGGIGFEPAEVEDPDISQKIGDENKRGWGLKIMRGLMDDVEFDSSERGTKVVMTKAKA